MKRVKSIIGIAMIAVLAVAMCAFSASAAMTLNVNVDKTQLEPGDTVTATVSVENYETVLAGFAVTIEYDEAALTLTEVTPENYGGEAVVDPEDLADANGSITIVWFTADPAGIASVNKLADLTFTAKAESDSAAISAGFKSDGMVSAGENLDPILPSEGVYSDETVKAPSIEVVPEGSLGGGEDPGESGAGSTSLTADGAENIDVFANYATGTTIDNYGVDIVWKDLSFVYKSDGETWDADNHKYVASLTGFWTTASIADAIVVTNHSSQPVTSTAAYNKVVNTVEGDIDTAEKTLTAWNAEGITNAVSYTLEVSGSIEQDFDDKVGTVTITIGGIPENYTPVAVPVV